MVRAMYRLVLVAAVAASACTQSDNNRPATLEYITFAILQPSCSQHVCHSSYRMESGFAFDTLELSKRSLEDLVVPGDPEASLLINVLTRSQLRMPYDAPLPDKDIELIEIWIAMGAPELEVVQ
jgi:hypothetical protein